MNGKRRISRKLAVRLADRLCLEPRRREEVLARFRAADAPAATITYEELDSDKFATISEWYHFGILSLMETTTFNDDPTWIAERLNIKVAEAVGAIERLLRLGLVRRDRGGKLTLTTGRLITSDGVRNLSLKRAHAASFALAQRSLMEDEVEVCDFSSITMAIDPGNLLEARRMIREFQDALSAKLEVRGKQTEVYQLCTQLFPLSQPTGA